MSFRACPLPYRPMDSAFTNLLRALATLWLGGCGVLAAATGGDRLLVDLDAADFTTGAEFWPQHTPATGIPGHFIPRGSPTRQRVAGAPAVVFDGDGDAFLGPITTAALHAPRAPYTVEIWVFQGNVREQEALVSWGKRGGPDASFAGFRYGAHPDFGAVAIWASTETGFKTVPPPGRWHHLAFTYDGKRLTVFVDGRLDGAKEVGTLDAHDTVPILLGAELGGNLQLEGKFTHFSGALGKVRIHGMAFDAATIRRHFETGSAAFPGVTARALARPPQHRFSCDLPAGPAPDGTRIGDSLGGMVAVVRGAGARFTGSGIRLPGGPSVTAAYLDFPNRMISGQENVTIELWETQEAALDWCRILSIGTNRTGEIPGPGGTFVGSETLTLFGNVGAAPINRFARSEGRLLNGGPDHDPADYPEAELGTEFHQVIVYEKSQCEWRWYRNGVLMEVIPDAEGPLTLDDVNVWLGRSEFSNDNNFRGTYREVRVYNRALPEDEIFGNWQAGPARLDLAKPVASANWAVTDSGTHTFGNSTRSDHWGNGPGGPHPDGIGAIATFATARTGDATVTLAMPITLGTLNLGSRGGAFTLAPQGEGSLTLDAGSAGPASVAQLPGALPGTVAVPVTLAAAVEFANLSDEPLLLAGPVRGDGCLVKTGPGPLVLTGDGTGFRGEARVLTGGLVLGDGAESGTLAATRFTVASGASLAVNRRDDLVIGPVLDGEGWLVHRGTGRLTLSEAAQITTTGFVDAADGAGPMVSEGRIDGAYALRTDTAMELAGRSNTRVREYLGVGYENGGYLTIRDGASVTLGGGQGALNVGDAGRGQSVLAMEGGTVFWSQLFVGKNSGTSGVLLQSGGDLTKRDGIAADSRIGGAFPGTEDVWGAWRLTGGTFSTNANLQVGAFGLGVLEIDGGTAAIRGFLGIGRFHGTAGAPGRGLVDVKAGRLALTAPDRLLVVGEEGVGVLNIRDRGVVVCANQLIIGGGTPAAPGSGTVNLLHGGTLTTAGIGQFNQAAATGTLFLNGGTLQAGADNPAFLEGLDQAMIGPAGVVIHTNGFNIGIAQPLLAAAGCGVRSIPVKAPGAGYLAPPLVVISGGGGSGATAVADLSDGRIRSLTVTHPGVGYGSPPTVRVLGGGGGSGLVAGAPVLEANRSGGLTKTGVGRLTLTGPCAYAGPTTVGQGELRVDGDLEAAAGTVSVAAGAVLGGCGRVGGSVEVAAGGSVAPGQPADCLKLAGGLVLRGTFAVAMADRQAGRIDVAGTLELDRATLVVTAADAPPARQAQVITTYGGLRGRFAEARLPAGFVLDYHYQGRNQLALVPTPGADGN